MAAPALDFWFEISFDLLVSGRHAHRCACSRTPELRCVCALPARTDFPGAGLEYVAIQSLSGKGPSHVARPRAHLRRAVAAVSAAGALSAIGPSGSTRGFGGVDIRPIFGSDRGRLGLGEDFCHAVYRAEFAEGRRIDQSETIRDILSELKVDPEKTLAAAQTDEIKDKLRAQTAEAQRLEIFGAPTFITADGELFWGNDRLESAIAWAKHVC